MCKIKHAAWVVEMALDYPVFHFFVLASQTFTNITAIYGMSTEGYIKYIYIYTQWACHGNCQSEEVLSINNMVPHDSLRAIY